MEALQNHENEDIYKLVYEIIDSYFGGVSEYITILVLWQLIITITGGVLIRPVVFGVLSSMEGECTFYISCPAPTKAPMHISAGGGSECTNF